MDNENIKSVLAKLYECEIDFTLFIAEKNVRTMKYHSDIFYATFYGFLDKCIVLGSFAWIRSEETQNLIRQSSNHRKASSV